MRSCSAAHWHSDEWFGKKNSEDNYGIVGKWEKFNKYHLLLQQLIDTSYEQTVWIAANENTRNNKTKHMINVALVFISFHPFFFKLIGGTEFDTKLFNSHRRNSAEPHYSNLYLMSISWFLPLARCSLSDACFISSSFHRGSYARARVSAYIQHVCENKTRARTFTYAERAGNDQIKTQWEVWGKSPRYDESLLSPGREKRQRETKWNIRDCVSA